MQWPSEDDVHGEIWDGYTVFQVKHKRDVSSSSENTAWLRRQIGEELERWADPTSGRDPVPDFMVIVSNVPLTPYPDRGGYDSLRSDIASFINRYEDDSRDVGEAATAQRMAKLARLRKIKGWQFWDAYQIEGLLDNHPNVRYAFPGFFTAGDVFANLQQFTDKIPYEKLEPTLRTHARTTLTSEGLIYFDEAGGSEGTGFPVHEIATDLPVTGGDGAKQASAIGYVLDRGERILKPSVASFHGPRHLVITGAPGNGKTTLSKFFVQVYRAAMLEGAASLSADQQGVIEGTKSALSRWGRELPRHRRWPMRIDLAEYAQEGGLLSDSTLLRWISRKVSARSNNGELTPSLMQSWMRRWPWFLVLDGLDEVTEPQTRKRLIQQVTEFVDEAEAEDYDTLVLLTTRPMGYTENVAPSHFQRIDLDYLELDEAVRYGELAIEVRVGKDLERAERAVRRLREAANDEALQNLLRTPLQVLILTIIVESSGQLAPDRFRLFWSYYETVSRRERDKASDFSALLREHSPQIQALHERVGYELQVRSQTSEHAYATLSHEELHVITWSVLASDGFQPGGRDADLLSRLLIAATHRLVLIAPRGDEGYGFDVRSLQELMAAMHLTNASDETVADRLRSFAASPHWRNAWIFAAGRLFASPQVHHRKAIVELVRTIDDQAPGRLGRVVPVGPQLALDLIDDGMARSLPALREQLMTQGLRVLLQPYPPQIREIAKVLLRYAESSDEQSGEVSRGIRHALDHHYAARWSALDLQRALAVLAADLNTSPRGQALFRVRRSPGAPAATKPLVDWALFDEEILSAPVGDALEETLLNAAAAIRRFADRTQPDPTSEDIALVQKCLEYAVAAEALEAATVTVAGDTTLFLRLRDTVMPRIHRAPTPAQGSDLLQ